MDDLHDSFLRLIHDPDGAATVLLDYGDPMWGPVELDGSQIIQVNHIIRAAGIQAIPRGNETHNLTFSLCRIQNTLQDALAGRINGMLTLPRGMADVLIALQDGRQWRIKNAACRAWSGGQTERLSREVIEITGGEIITDSGVSLPGETWSADNGFWES